MEIWYEGVYGNNQRFKLYKDEARTLQYPLELVDKPVITAKEYFETSVMGPKGAIPHHYFVFQTGSFIFPKSWGPGQLYWPRFIPMWGSDRLIRLNRAEGKDVEHTAADEEWLTRLRTLWKNRNIRS